MFDCDLHTHSRFFHRDPEFAAGYDPYSVRATLRIGRRCGLNGVAVTNHDFFRQETMVSDACIPGIEISTTEGHLLVIGPNPPERTQAGTLSPNEAVELAHRHDCVAIVAHPFRNSRLRESEADFDAIEINGKHPEHRERIQRIASDRNLPIVGGSDAHFPFEVGRLSTRLDIDRLTPDAVVDAIQDGRVEPVVRDGRLTQILGTAYSNIHRLRGHL